MSLLFEIRSMALENRARSVRRNHFSSEVTAASDLECSIDQMLDYSGYKDTTPVTIMKIYIKYFCRHLENRVSAPEPVEEDVGDEVDDELEAAVWRVVARGGCDVVVSNPLRVILDPLVA